MGKYAAHYGFEVIESIYNLDEKLGVSFEDIMNGNIGGFDNYSDLFAEYEEANSGDITVNEEYASDGAPQFCEEDRSLYARFYATYDIIVEADNDETAMEQAEKMFRNADFGSYEYLNVCDFDRTETIDRLITVSDIMWDLDGADIKDIDFWTEMDIPYSAIEGDDFDEVCQNIEDYLSNETGFCQKGFSIDKNDEDYLKSLFKDSEKNKKINEINRE